MSGGTHTYALLDVSPATFQEIHGRLTAAGYEHAFIEDGTVIDMHGIGLRASLARERADSDELLPDARIRELLAVHRITDCDVLKHTLEDHDRWRAHLLARRGAGW